MYIKRILLFAAAGLLLLQTSCSSQNKGLPVVSAVPYYLVTVDESNIRNVKVEAILPLVTDTIYMSQGEYQPLRNGYAEFVNDLTATDSKGNTIGLISVGKGIWKANTHVPGTIRIKYNVSIKHDNVQWEVSSAFARAYAVDKVLFFAGRCVFIAPAGSDSSKITVKYNLPGGWDIATPYTNVDAGSHIYEAKNLGELWRNGNFIGQFVQREINVGKLKVIIAGTPDMDQGVNLFQSALTKIVNSYKNDMGDAPEGKLVIMGSVSSLSQGGEAFRHSISVMFNQTPTMANKRFWGYLLAHEVFHLWNGGAISPLEQSKVEWFVEGFTEYMSMFTAYRTGFNSRQEYLQQLTSCRSTYLSNAGKISLVDAGLHKGANYDLIYTGGMSVALALDIETRMATQNKRGVVDIIKSMYAKFGKTHSVYSYQDIIKVSSEVSGKDLSGFFNDYVSGLKVLPFEKYIDYAGLETGLQNGGVIQPKPNPTAAESKLMAAFLYK